MCRANGEMRGVRRSTYIHRVGNARNALKGVHVVFNDYGTDGYEDGGMK